MYGLHKFSKKVCHMGGEWSRYGQNGICYSISIGFCIEVCHKIDGRLTRGLAGWV